MLEVMDLLKFSNPVFTTYLFWTGVLALKMMAMSSLTAIQRIKKMVFANPEDVSSPKAKLKLDDPDVERVRRAHLNDLETLTPYFIIGLLFVLTNPQQYLAINLYRVIGISRIAHTLVYAVIVMPQPSRIFAWLGSYIPMIYMGVSVILSFW